MKQKVLFFFVLFGLIRCAGQTGPVSDPQSRKNIQTGCVPESTTTSRYSFGAVEGKGTIRYINISGGFYGIIADDGKKYNPTNLSAEFKKDSLKVEFAGTKKIVFGIQMWGVSIELTDIKKAGFQEYTIENVVGTVNVIYPDCGENVYYIEDASRARYYVNKMPANYQQQGMKVIFSAKVTNQGTMNNKAYYQIELISIKPYQVSYCTDITGTFNELLQSKVIKEFGPGTNPEYVLNGSYQPVSANDQEIFKVRKTGINYYEYGVCENVGDLTSFTGIGDTSEGITFYQGNMYVTSSIDGKVFKIDHKKNKSVFVENLVRPAAIVFDNRGNLWVAEAGNFNSWYNTAAKVSVFNTSGKKIKEYTQANNGTDWFGNPKMKKFQTPNGMVCAFGSKVFMSDSKAKVIVQFDLNNGTAKVVSSFTNWKSSPNGMTFDWQYYRIYVNDSGTGEVHILTLDTNANIESQTKINLSKTLNALDGIALDIEGNLYVTYNYKHLAKINPQTGKVTDIYTGEGLKTPANISFGGGPHFDYSSLYITQLGYMENLNIREGATEIKKIYIGKPGTYFYN